MAGLRGFLSGTTTIAATAASALCVSVAASPALAQQTGPTPISLRTDIAEQDVVHAEDETDIAEQDDVRAEDEYEALAGSDVGWLVGASFKTWGVQDSFSLGTVRTDSEFDLTSRGEPYAFIMNGGVFTLRAPSAFLRQTTFNLTIGFGEGDTEIIQRGGDFSTGQALERVTDAKMRRYDFELDAKTRALGDVVALVVSGRYERVRIDTATYDTLFDFTGPDPLTPTETRTPASGSRLEAYDLYTARTGLEIKVPVTPNRATEGFANFLLAGGYRDAFAQDEVGGVIGDRSDSAFFSDEWLVGIDVSVGVTSTWRRKWRADLVYRLTNYSPLSETALVGSNQTVQGISFRLGYLLY